MQRRMTKQRRLVMEAIKNTNIHPTAEQVYQLISRENPDISLATVYRNLNLLVEQEDVVRITTPDDTVHFDGNVSPHYHALCQDCGSIVDVYLQVEEGFFAQVEEECGFLTHSHELILYGTCAVCQYKTKEKEEEP